MHYCVTPKDDSGERYWLQAVDQKQARRLVALNVPAAKKAEKEKLFDCAPDSTKKPPIGFIYRALLGPVAIDKV